MPQIILDGRSLDFEPGETIIQVATREHIVIPHYCWHHKLSVAANCRMCLVEVEKAPKLLPACQTECRDGMVVHTQSECAKEAQGAVQEFLLVNHPVDCPVCDQVGECKLQDYYMDYQHAPSRVKDPRVTKPRSEQLGPYVMYNAERCILCTRCIRFMEQVAKERQLGVFKRGNHARIGTFPGKSLDHPYSLNTVDLCPVGALTSRVFRFKQRVWNLARSPSLCPGCARGCNIFADHRSGLAYRFVPRENDHVNECWLCDEGRLTYARANEDRLDQPINGRTGERIGVDEAVKQAVRLLEPAAKTRQGLGAAISLHATCEQAYAFGRIVKEVFNTNVVGLLEYATGEDDPWLKHKDKNPNRVGIAKVFEDLEMQAVPQTELEKSIADGQVRVLLCVGHESQGLATLAESVKKLEGVVQLACTNNVLAKNAHVVLPTTSWLETHGTWVNANGRAQALLASMSSQKAKEPAHIWLMRLAEGIGVSFAWPSLSAMQNEMEKNLKAFASVSLSDLGDSGKPLS